MVPFPIDMACPATGPNPEGVAVEILVTGTLKADWKLVVDDGTEGPITMTVPVGLIHHPKGLVAVDAGLGKATREGRYPIALMAGDNQIPDGAPLSERLPRPPDLFLMTHLHWDHVSGLLDFSRPRAMIWDAEWDEYGGGKAMFGAELREGVDWVVVSNAGGGARQVLGQPAIDLYGDGKIWYLQLHGHTPGAAAVLVQGIDGPYLFVGDTAWVDRHLEDTRRPPLTRAVVDARKRQARQSLDWARWYQAHCPELKIITGHDPKWAPTSP